MWVLSGEFDTEEVGANEKPVKKYKLLKPNKSYTLGRKDQPLLVKHKKISHAHCEFIVGGHTIEDAGNFSIRPSLKVLNLSPSTKKKVVKIKRIGTEDDILAESEVPEPLQDGDEISLTSGVAITVHWKPICAYYPSIGGKSHNWIGTCASLGIKIVHKLQHDITHHLTNQYEANLRMATSLLSLCQIVKPEWLQEVIRLGKLEGDNEEGVSLEEDFSLPDEKRFRPGFAASLPPQRKVFGIWDPDEARVNLLCPFRFICLQEKVTELESDLKEALQRGGGTYEVHDIHSGLPNFHKVLVRAQAKEDKKSVVIGNIDAMKTAIGNDEWHRYIEEARSFNMEIVPTSTIVDVALTAKTTSLQPNATDETQPRVIESASIPTLLPEISHDKQESELSPVLLESPAVVPPRKRLVRRATSRAPSQEPSTPLPTAGASTSPSSIIPASAIASEAPPTTRPRRVLARRVKSANVAAAFGVEEEQLTTFDKPLLSRITPEPVIQKSVMPTPARSRLKRRVGVDNATNQQPMSDTLSSVPDTVEEPPHKKFKALFEASNPTGNNIESMEERGSLESTSQTQTQSPSQTQTQSQAETQVQTQTRLVRRNLGASTLSILREEEEESQFIAGTAPGSNVSAGSKRKAPPDTEDHPMNVDEDPAATVKPASKKRAIENDNALARADAPDTQHGVKQPPSTAKPSSHGAAPGKPDIDAAFLKAIASTKRGKKAEDDFDREFNQLKISKPEMNRVESENEWGVLADFGDDSGLRGNFMVVVEMDVYKKDEIGKNVKVLNPDWNGKQNFKKFKKKIVGAQKPKVDLFLNQADDYGMGAAYWKGKTTQSNTRTHADLVDETQFEIRTATQTRKNTKGSVSKIQDDNDDEYSAPLAPVRNGRKPPSRAASITSTRSATARGKAKGSVHALFLDSDDDIVEIHHEDAAADSDDHDYQSQTLLSSAGVEMTGKSIGGKKATRAANVPKKPAPIIVEDDSDDEAIFKGFGGRKRR